MTVFLFSLAGMPPTGGFLGKYVVFQAAIESEQYLLAVVGILAAVVAAYYYLRVIVAMWMREPESDEFPLPVSPSESTWICRASEGSCEAIRLPAFSLLVFSPLDDATSNLMRSETIPPRTAERMLKPSDEISPSVVHPISFLVPAASATPATRSSMPSPGWQNSQHACGFPPNFLTRS